MERRLAAIMAADVVGYSRLMSVDEQGTLTRLKALRRDLFDPEVTKYGGRIVKLMGDGALVEFASVVAAVECAAVVQTLVVKRNSELDDEKRIDFRIGINLGDVIVDGDDIYGDGVNIAARLEGLADSGGICVSRTVFDQVKSKVELNFSDLGEQALKNIEEPIQAYQISTKSDGSNGGQPAAQGLSFELQPRQRPTIAILPFKNLSPDPEEEYLADGMRLGIQAGLVLLPGLFLINAPAVAGYRNKDVTGVEAAKVLGVRYLLEGAVQKAGQRVRATLQLTDTKAGEVVWAERYDRDLTDLFELQDEITREVLVSLNVRLFGRDVTRVWFKRLTNPKARELFMHGNYHLYTGGARHNEEARRIFEQMHELDPAIGHGPGLVALTHWLDAFFGWSESTRKSAGLAYKWARKAIEYEEMDGFGHAVLGHLQLYDRKYDEALANCQMAVGLRDSCPLAYGLLASAQVYCGDARTAVKNARTALQLESVYPPWLINVLASAYRDCGDVEQSILAAKEVVRMAPDVNDGRLVLCSDYKFANHDKEASRLAEEIVEIQPAFRLSTYAPTQPYRDAATLERVIESLRSVGLPE